MPPRVSATIVEEQRRGSLVNNAGAYFERWGKDPIGGIDFEDWEETLRVNTLDPMRVTEALLAQLARGDRPLVLAITSNMGSIAGQRVRMAEAIVEVRDRAPFAVVRRLYEMLGFDAEGRLDRATFMRQNAALAELAMDSVIPRSVTKETAVVDAGSRFVVRGGRWQPSPSLEQEILRAALGELKCERL